MKTSHFNRYVISAWAEKTDQGWAGLASVHPPITNTWTGGPNGDSMVTDGMHMTEQEAERAGTVEAMDAISAHLRLSEAASNSASSGSEET